MINTVYTILYTLYEMNCNIHNMQVCHSFLAGAALGNGNVIHMNKSTLQQDCTHESPYIEYDSVGVPASNETVEFNNSLYSDIGPVTVTETTIYETVSTC